MPECRAILGICYARRIPPWQLGISAEEEKEGWEADRGAGGEACRVGCGIAFVIFDSNKEEAECNMAFIQKVGLQFYEGEFWFAFNSKYVTKAC